MHTDSAIEAYVRSVHRDLQYQIQILQKVCNTPIHNVLLRYVDWMEDVDFVTSRYNLGDL